MSGPIGNVSTIAVASLMAACGSGSSKGGIEGSTPHIAEENDKKMDKLDALMAT